MKIMFIVIIIAFLFCPYIIDQIFIESSNNASWFGFLGSYLGGGITALITLFGIYWQFQEIKKSEIKNKNEGLLKLISYKINRNISKEFPYKILGQDEYFEYEEEVYFEGFKENLTIENEKLILTLKNGKEILEAIDNIDNYNKLFAKYIFNNKKIEKRICEIDNLVSQNKLDEDNAFMCIQVISRFRSIVKTLYAYDTLLYSFINEDVTKIFLNEKEVLEKFKKVIIENLDDIITHINFMCGKELIIKKEIIKMSESLLIYREKMSIIEYELFLKNFFCLEKKLVSFIYIFSSGIKLENGISKLLIKELNEYLAIIKMRETLLDKKNEILLKSKKVLGVLKSLIEELK